MIDKAKQGAIIDSVYGYKEAINNFYIQQLSENPEFELDGSYMVRNGKLENYEILFSGQIPVNGTLVFKNNEIQIGCLTIDEYRISIKKNDIKLKKGSCEILDNQRIYNIGDSVNYAGYDWHIINADDNYITLLMDYGRNSEMPKSDKYTPWFDSYYNVYRIPHCTNDTNPETDCGVDETGQYYVYSWDKSLIQTYLNSTFYEHLVTQIANNIIPTNVCNDPSRNDNLPTYGGLLESEIPKNAKCETTITPYMVRLISKTEINNINQIQIEDKKWLHPTMNGYPVIPSWTMIAVTGTAKHQITSAIGFYGASNGNKVSDVSYIGKSVYGLRPVIVIQK